MRDLKQLLDVEFPNLIHLPTIKKKQKKKSSCASVTEVFYMQQV